MIIKENLYSFLNKAVKYPAIIVNDKFSILFKNDAAENEFQKGSNNLLLNNEVYAIIEDGIKKINQNAVEYYESVESIKINSLICSIIVLKLNEESNYLVYFKTKDKELDYKTKQVKINIAEIEDVVKDKNLLKLFEFIEDNYPFTIIAKARLKKDINELNNLFWIKDRSGKIIIGNELFLNFTAKNDTTDLFQFDENIFENKSLLTINGAYSENRELSVVKLPLLNINNEVEAIVCLTYNLQSNNENPFHKEILLKFPYPLMLVNNENKLELVSEHFYNSKIDLENVSVMDFFSKETVSKIQQFWNSDKLEVRQRTEINPKYFDISERVSYYKVGTEKKKYVLLLFDNKLYNQSQTEANKKMYDVIMHTSPEAIFIYDIENLRFVEVNAIALKMYGYTRDDFLQMDLTDLYAPEDIQTLIENTKYKNTNAGEFSGPWRHKKKDGKSILVEISKSTIDYKGKKAHFNIIKDVTPQLEKEKEVQLFKATFEATSDPIVLTDRDGFITYVNKSVVNNLGYRYDDIMGKSILSLVSDGERASINSAIFHSGDKDAKRIKSKIKTYTNEEIPAEINSSPIVNYDGSIESYNLTINLKAEPKEPRKEIKIVTEKNTQSFDTSFLANLFHELLTPINVIIGFAQELVESVDNPDKEQLEASQIIKENHKNLMMLMDSSAEYASLIADNFKLSKSDIRFVDLIHEIEDSVAKVSKDEKTQLSYGKISSSLEFNSDRQRILSFINLLITIAIKITRNQKLFLSSSKFDSNNAYISIRDEKNSISSHLAQGLESIFSENEDELKRKYGISRFSIRLLRKLLDVLKLSVEIDSANSDDFKVILPFKLDDEEEKAPEVSTKYEDKKIIFEKPKTTSSPVPQLDKVSESKAIDFSNYECLYVEDQFESQTLFKVQMKDLKSISYATGLEDALPLIKSKKFDFIILDINLKGEYNGLDTLRFIRQIPGYQDVPIIAVTAYVLPGDRDNFIAAGFNDFISKPVLRDKIIESLKRVLV